MDIPTLAVGTNYVTLGLAKRSYSTYSQRVSQSSVVERLKLKSERRKFVSFTE